MKTAVGPAYACANGIQKKPNGSSRCCQGNLAEQVAGTNTSGAGGLYPSDACGSSHDDLGLAQSVENLAIEQLIAKAGVEALDVAVLPRAAPLDVGGLGTDSRDPFAPASDDREHRGTQVGDPHVVLELRHVLFGGGFFGEGPRQHELGLEHRLRVFHEPSRVATIHAIAECLMPGERTSSASADQKGATINLGAKLFVV